MGGAECSTEWFGAQVVRPVDNWGGTVGLVRLRHLFGGPHTAERRR
jgi:hypothetical protein